MSIQTHITDYLDRIKPSRCFVSNIFNTDYENKVLISYIVTPFNGSKKKGSHSNVAESIKIAEIFNSQKFTIDVVRFDCNAENISKLRENYDLLFGIDPNFSVLINKYPKAKKIYYGTGAYCKFQNDAETKRIEELETRKGVKLNRRRLVPDHDSSERADSMILIGNDWTRSTYENHIRKIETVRVTSSAVFLTEVRDKEWGPAKKRFLWFGSVGAVHKGLDLLLEIFTAHPDLELYVCGAVEQERDFVRLYQNELFRTPNIHCIGWVDPKSQEFADLVRKCAFAIMPSCSEGMSSSIATSMHVGLIPLVSRETGIDVDTSGSIFANNSISEIEAAILAYSAKSEGEIEILSRSSVEIAKKYFTLARFENDFSSALKKLIREASN